MHSPSSELLPPPDPDALHQSWRLHGRIREAICDAGGALEFSRFMHMALYEPGLGYYVSGLAKLGAAGDFVTAPELSPIFARCLAGQISQILDRVENGEIIEFGGGTGALAVDLMLELERLDSLPPRYRILEPSPELRDRQRRRIADTPAWLADRFEWIDAVPDRPVRGVVLANEVMDAMPVCRFRIASRGTEELCVGLGPGGELEWRARPAGALTAEAVEMIHAALGYRLPQGYTSEWNPALACWIESVSAALDVGVVLLVDYGYPQHEYYHPQRNDGTLICHYRHRCHFDPLVLVGLQDISASVDFTALARSGTAAGLDLLGYTTQAWFLTGCGLERHHAGLASTDPVSRATLSNAARRLLLPGEMGDRFKVMALGRRMEHALGGFNMRDHSARLFTSDAR